MAEFLPLPQRRRKKRGREGEREAAPPTEAALHPTEAKAAEDDDRPDDVITFDSNLTCVQYEYLDHTADIQLHSWGATLEECLEQLAVCMFGYMTELEAVAVVESRSKAIKASGHDMLSLVFNYLDELLFRFHTDGLVVKDIKIVHLDTEEFTIRAHCKGDVFDLAKHPQGTEIKAITYSNMQVVGFPPEGDAPKVEAYVIVDI